MGYQLIGLSGYARSGKDAAAECLVNAGWTRRAFADKIKDSLVALDPLIHRSEGWPIHLSSLVEYMGWDYAKEALPDVRLLLQRLGTEVGRQILGEEVWVDALFDSLEDGGSYVITDARFTNEAQAIVDRGGLMIRIERPQTDPAVDGGGVVHISETALDDWEFDRVVINNGTLEELHEKVRRTVSGWWTVEVPRP